MLLLAPRLPALAMANGDVLIGISGWRYAPWRGVFYPHGLPQKDELAHASRQLRTIEINGSFYSLQRPAHYQAWHDATPDDFVFSVKAPRYITHVLRLQDVRVPLANFLASGVLALGGKLGPFLWQFPPSMRWDAARFEAFFALLPRDTGAALALAAEHDAHVQGRAWLDGPPARPLLHAVEVRHASFVDPAFLALAWRHGIAVVVADTAGRWPLFEQMISSDFAYLRLHGDAELYASGYGSAALDGWAARIAGWRRGGRHVFCYFDNDIKVHAPFDAAQLAQRLGAGPPQNAGR